METFRGIPVAYAVDMDAGYQYGMLKYSLLPVN